MLNIKLNRIYFRVGAVYFALIILFMSNCLSQGTTTIYYPKPDPTASGQENKVEIGNTISFIIEEFPKEVSLDNIIFSFPNNIQTKELSIWKIANSNSVKIKLKIPQEWSCCGNANVSVLEKKDGNNTVEIGVIPLHISSPAPTISPISTMTLIKDEESSVPFRVNGQNLLNPNIEIVLLDNTTITLNPSISNNNSTYTVNNFKIETTIEMKSSTLKVMYWKPVNESFNSPVQLKDVQIKSIPLEVKAAQKMAVFHTGNRYYIDEIHNIPPVTITLKNTGANNPGNTSFIKFDGLFKDINESIPFIRSTPAKGDLEARNITLTPASTNPSPGTYHVEVMLLGDKYFANIVVVDNPTVSSIEVVDTKENSVRSVGAIDYDVTKSDEQTIVVRGINISDEDVEFSLNTNNEIKENCINLVEAGDKSNKVERRFRIKPTVNVDYKKIIGQVISLSIKSRTNGVSVKNNSVSSTFSIIEPKGVLDIISDDLAGLYIDNKRVEGEIKEVGSSIKLKIDQSMIPQNKGSQYLSMGIIVYDESGNEVDNIPYKSLTGVKYAKVSSQSTNANESEKYFTWDITATHIQLKDKINAWYTIKFYVMCEPTKYNEKQVLPPPIEKIFTVQGSWLQVIANSTLPPIMYLGRLGSIDDSTNEKNTFKFQPSTFNLGICGKVIFRNSNGKICPFSVGLNLMGLNILSSNASNLSSISTNTITTDKDTTTLTTKNQIVDGNFVKTGDIGIVVDAELRLWNPSSRIYIPLQFLYGIKFSNVTYLNSMQFWGVGIGLDIKL